MRKVYFISWGGHFVEKQVVKRGILDFAVKPSEKLGDYRIVEEASLAHYLLYKKIEAGVDDLVYRNNGAIYYLVENPL